MKKIYLLLLTVLFAAVATNAQVANYSFTQTAGTYTTISGGTFLSAVGATDDDLTFSAVPIGFSFTYNGTAYTTLGVNSNGYMAFGGTAPGNFYDGTSIQSVANAVHPFSEDLYGLGATQEIQYLVTGAVGSRVFTIQWKDWGFFSTGGNEVNFQLKLYETTNVIQFVYKPGTPATTQTCQAGLTGTTVADFNSRTTASNWSASTASVANTNQLTFTAAIFPANGLTYTFTPPPPCATPSSSASGLVLTPFSSSQINGSFTASPADFYLTVRYPTGASPVNPVNGTTYSAGASLGTGKVVSASSALTFNATGLTPSTTYDFYVYPYNNTGCTGGPNYKTTVPATGTQTSAACAPLAAGTYTVGPTGTYASLTAVTAALANGTSGPTIFELQSTYLSTVETFPVTFGAAACALTGGVTIRPQAGAAGLSITSANATGTLNFDGGSNITIDGRAGGAGPSQLTISNTNVTGYTIHLINSASSNTFRYLTIAGVNTGAASGVIFFDNAVGLPAGNSNNTIDNCDIRDGATTPQNLIYCSGNITDYASGNNNNTISNSLLHDWFNATSTTASAAIRLFQGGSDWTITGNSFYQSATRTFTMTAATDQSAINITSALFGTNFTITNNFIGGSAPLCGGTAWTYTATTGTPTAKMINLIAAPVVTMNTISGNTLQNISVTTATTNNLSGLISHQSGNVNITNNTMGSQSATGNVLFTLTNTSAGVFYLPLAFGLGTSPCIVNATNNNIGGITVANSSTGGCSFRVVYSQAVAGSQLTVNNNLIGGTVANSIQQLTNNLLHGILILNPTVGGIYTNNTVRNLTQINAGVTGSVVGVNIQASGGGHTITGNTVSNLTTNGTNVAINNAASVVGITMTGSAVGGTNISSNIISNLTNTNTTVAGWINGIYIATAASNPQTIISKNFVHSINLASTLNTAGMAGIFLPNTGFARVFNNMVRLGIDATGASITNGLQINGIRKDATATMSIYHNSVYIGGTGVASGTANTYAFRRVTSGATQDTVMNNIFYNARSNASGTGKHYATSLNAATVLFSNYNDLFATGTGGVLGINVATDYTTLAAWRTATNQDWNSVSGDPQFVNPTGTSATVDLHISAAATPIEQAGYNLTTVTDDYDAQARAGLTPVDLGADAGNFTVTDVAPPVIYLTPLLLNTCSTADRAVNGINITDATGVPTSGTLRPRIYYRKNAGAYFSQPGTLASGSATNGIWNFNIVAADMGGLVATDVVSYYIIAQDIVGTPNIASNFGGAVATDVNTVTTQPTTPNTYTINGASLSGTYTVGAAGTYTTLTAAVAAYNSACLTGPVLFSLIDAAYAGETFPITINANQYASSVNTLTIKPTLAATSISGTSATGLIVLNAADWVTINGSISATVNTVCPAVAATRDLTLTNTNASTASAVIWLQSTSAFDAATNNNILNLNLVGNSNTTTFVGVGSGSTTISTASLGFGNINNTYINNNISKTQYGVFSQGSSLGFKNTGTIINQNLINTVAPNNTARGGIVTGFENGITISGNNISEIALASSPDVFGIAAGGISVSNTGFTGNEVTNAVITKNIIGSVRNTGNSFSACGLFVATALSGTNLIANNTISGVSANPTSPDVSMGMLLGGGTGTTQVYYNTVTMTNVNPLVSSSMPSYAVAIGGFNPIVDMRNNILVNTQNNGTGNNYAVGYGYTPFTNLTSNNNDYYTATGATFFIGATGSLSAPTNQATVAALQAATAKDGAAQNVLPVFISASDLHLSAAANTNWCLNNKGVALSVTDDIDCQVRNNPPDIGADEFTATGTDIATPSSQTLCSGTPITTIVLSGGATSYSWTRNNTVAVTGIAASGTGNISGTLTNTTGLPVTVTFTISPLDAAGCAGPGITATVTVNPTNTITLTSAPGTDAQTVCINTPITNITYSTTAATGATFSGLPAGVTGNWAANVVTISGTPTTSVGSPFSYTVTLTGGGTCGTLTATGTITVTPNNTIVLTSAPATTSQTVCINTAITNITYATTGATGATFSGLPAGVTGSWVANVVTISGSPTTTVGSPFSYTVTLTGGCGTITANGTITVNPNNTITLTSAPATTSQTVCINTPITNITYATTGATGATFSGLPAGVTGSWAANVVTISGTPTTTVGSPFSYTVTLTGGCGSITANGTITVTPNNTITLTSAPGTNAQTVCANSPIVNITYSTTGATGATFSGLPAGVTGSWASNVVTISGTPTTSVGSPFSYTVTLTGGCGAITANGTITVNPQPVITSTQVEPTTCASADGSINITVTGAAGPYTYAWTGSGVNPTSEDQINLTVGSYSVTVTAANGCIATANFALAGPGGCSICPTIPNFTTTPSGGACAGSNVTFTASGLTDMGTTYGIIFKYSAVILPNPYVGGTVIATVLNGALTGGKTVATANSATIPVGNYYVYAILTPTPVDPACRPAGQVQLTIGAVPDVNQPASQVVCNNTATAPVNFTGSVPGTVYNWTNSTPSIGLAASGTGNIASFTATNATTAPVVATVTVTPSYTSTTSGSSNTTFNYTGTIQTYTVPAGVTSITIDGVGAQGGSVNVTCAAPGGLGARMKGDFAVTPGEILSILIGGQGLTNGQDAGGGGGTYIVRAGNIPLLVAGGGGGASNDINACRNGANRNGVNASITTSGTASGDGVVAGGTAGNGGGANNGSGGGGGGFFTNGTAGTGLPGNNGKSYLNGSAGGTGNNNDSGGYGGGGAGWFTGGNGGGGGGYSGGGTNGGQPYSGGGGGGSYNVGTNQLNQAGIGTGNGSVIISANASSITCTGTPKTFTITVNPTPTVNAQANQTVCVGTVTTANFTGAVPGTVYNWTNTNTAIGLGASGSGNISFTSTNATTAPISGTITVTPSYTNAGTTCTGTPITFTITVNPTPTVNTQPNQTVCVGTVTTATFTGAVPGTVYNWTNSNTSIGLGANGSGNISFTSTNATNAAITGTITVTPSYTNGGTTCTGTAITFTITVNPVPVVNPVTSQTVCNGALTAPVNFVSPTTGPTGSVTFTWTNSNTAIGLGASGTGNIPAFTGTNATAAPISGTITVTPVYTGGSVTCTGTPVSFTITVNPTPTVNAQANQTVCVGTVTTATFTGAVAGTVYNWTNNNTAIGLGASGTGNISFTSTNAGVTPIAGTITVTPTYTNGGTTCSGTPITFTITVNPTPTVNQPANQSLCPGTLTAPVNFTGAVAGTVYNWTNNNVTIGLAASGTGNIPAFIGLNPGSTPNVGTITVTPSYTNGGTTCTGTPRTFTITVTPNAPLVIVADPGTTICEGDPTLLTVYDAGTAAGGTIPLGAQTGTFAGNARGYWFTAPTSFTMTALRVPTDASAGNQNVAVVRFTGATPPPAFPATTNAFTTLFVSQNNPAAGNIPVSIAVNAGDVIGILGTRGADVNSYRINPNTTTIGGFTVNLTRMGMQFPLATTAPQQIWTEAASISRVFFDYTIGSVGPQSTGTFLWTPAAGLSSTTSNPVAASPMNTTTYTVTRTTVPGGCTASASITITVNKRPVVTTQPVNTVRCVGSTATFTVGATGTGLIYQWQESLTGCAGTFVNLTNGGQYSGVNTATLNISGVTSAMNGRGYRVIVTGTCAPVNNANISNCATLTVNPLPVVSITPPISCGGVAGISGTALSVGSAPPPVPGSVTVNSGTINLAVPDNTANGVSNTIAMAGVPANATITNVTVTLNNFSHTYPGDIIMHLKAPNGQILNLYKYGTGVFTGAASGVPTWGWYGSKVSQTGTTAWSTVATAPYIYNNSTNWKADAINTPVAGAVIQNPTGFVSTATGFADLYTTPASTTGNWTLAMCDGGPGDVGTLASWGITIDYTTPGTGGANNSYVWSPLAGLYTNSTATTPYTGQNLSTVYAAPTVFTVYTVTATDNVTGCVNTATAFVNYTPPAPTVTPSSVTMCLGDAAVRLVSSSSTTSSLQVCSGPISVVIPDNNLGGATSNLTVSGVPAGCNISAMSVTLNMNHTWDGDVAMALKAPNGQILNLDYYLSATGGTGATTGFVNTKISSTGTAALSSGSNPYTGTFRADASTAAAPPAGPTGFAPTTTNWAALYSVPNGTWTLAMVDAFGGDQGTLTSWCIDMTYVCGVPATAATWSPIAGLFNDAAATIPYAGTPRDTVWTRPTTIGANTYLVTVQSVPVPPLAFANTAPIVINAVGTASPSPANLNVSGLPTTGVTVRNVNISGLSHTWAGDVNIVLQSPSGQNVILMANSNADPQIVLNGVNLTFSDAATASIPATGAIPSGTYLPTNRNGATFAFLPPGPTVTGPTFPASPTLSTFTGNVNGTWKLFVEDRVPGDQGSISGGFSIGFDLGIAACTSPARTVVVTVNQPTTLNNSLPANTTVCTDKVATFTVAVATGTGPFSYQWQVSTDNGNTFTNITNGGVYSGATTATLTITAPPVTMSGYQYRAIVTGAAPCASVTSFKAVLTVNPLPVVSISANRTSLFPGLTATISSTVGPFAAASYTWLRDGVVLSSGAQGIVSGIGTTPLVVNVDGFGTYKLRVTDVNGCNGESNSITIKDSASGKCFIYPNPTSGQFEVRYYSTVNNVVPRSLTVFDAKGERVFTKLYPIGRPYDRMPVDMRAYGKGLYWVEVTGTNGERLTICRVAIQ